LKQEASNSDDVKASTPGQEKLSPSVAPHKLLPSSLESLEIRWCDGFSEVVDLPSSDREISIQRCSKLRFISGQLDALKKLVITNSPELRSLESLCITDLSALETVILEDCISLASLPSGPEPQEYSSLWWLKIRECPGIKSLPSALQQRLDSGLEYTSLDSRLEGTPYAPIFPVWCVHKSCVCMSALSSFFGGHATVHVCPVISNPNAYYVLILTELEDIYLKSY
jgi:hypothetical protein